MACVVHDKYTDEVSNLAATLSQPLTCSHCHAATHMPTLSCAYAIPHHIHTPHRNRSQSYAHCACVLCPASLLPPPSAQARLMHEWCESGEVVREPSQGGAGRRL